VLDYKHEGTARFLPPIYIASLDKWWYDINTETIVVLQVAKTQVRDDILVYMLDIHNHVFSLSGRTSYQAYTVCPDNGRLIKPGTWTRQYFKMHLTHICLPNLIKLYNIFSGKFTYEFVIPNTDQCCSFRKHGKRVQLLQPILYDGHVIITCVFMENKRKFYPTIYDLSFSNNSFHLSGGAVLPKTSKLHYTHFYLTSGGDVLTLAHIEGPKLLLCAFQNAKNYTETCDHVRQLSQSPTRISSKWCPFCDLFVVVFYERTRIPKLFSSRIAFTKQNRVSSRCRLFNTMTVNFRYRLVKEDDDNVFLGRSCRMILMTFSEMPGNQRMFNARTFSLKIRN
jgi:hypothetical protein